VKIDPEEREGQAPLDHLARRILGIEAGDTIEVRRLSAGRT